MKRHQSILENRPLGHLLAFLFFVALGYSMYLAGSSINYIWKWNTIPKYFAYEHTVALESTLEGRVKILSPKEVEIVGEEGSEKFLVAGYELAYEEGEIIYPGEVLAKKGEYKIGPLLLGLWMTIKISLISGVIAFFIGAILALMKISKAQVFRDIATVYIEVIRGTPLLVQIFIFYFIIATIFEIDSFYAGAISLAIFYGAYIAEVLRGAIQSIDKGQQEAALSLGMNYFQTMTLIIIPQALKRSLPSLTGEMIALIKDSSLVSVISVTDLTKVGREMVANTFSPFETWIVVAIMYFAITSSLSLLAHRLEDNMKKRGGMS
ncbi:amino acid ABC transporter permease [Wolinella succinogenes]|uniref:amino acid ABC transporter permease n=1 Tax=Wolinella succinogenes TaxID=844 RepID=UPI00240958B6|nr:amino acid ABC transporter permease [Wolinella succinogenes]